MKNRMTCTILVLVLLLTLLAGCGDTATPSEDAASTATSVSALEPSAAVSEQPEQPPVEGSSAEDVEASVLEEPGIPDLTEADRNLDYSGRMELIKGMTTELPITEVPTEFSYWLGIESSTLQCLKGNDINNHPVWDRMEELTGIKINIIQTDALSRQEKFDLMIASGDYSDLTNGDYFTKGVEYGLEEDIIIDLTDLIPEYAPNYWTLINSDRDVYAGVQSTTGKLLSFWWMKDEVATPDDMGPFVRMDWLEDLDMEVPTTYDELFDVLTAFKVEKGATEPLMLYNQISLPGGCLMGGFGAVAEYNNEMASVTDGFFLEDGQVVYGATADGSRDYLSYLNKLKENGLIDFDTMLVRSWNPIADITAGYAETGVTGYIYQNQPFGGVYTELSTDPNCNWWPVQDVGKAKDDINSFASEVSLLKKEGFCISSQCSDPELAVKWIDFWYSYDGYVLANYGFENESFVYDSHREPQFMTDVIYQYDTVSLAMNSLTTMDASGIYCDLRLDFTYDERESACFDAWMTNKNSNSTIGSRCNLTPEESNEAAAIYGDIQTYVASCAMQFINGDLDVNDDATWNNFVSTVEGMNVARVADLVQTAYDRVYKT